MTTPQLLPLNIDYDGPAPVDTYFNVKTEENGTKTAAFRGRSMYGTNLGLPDGYTGVVLSTKTSTKGDIKNSKDEGGTRLGAVSTFSEIGLWRADVPVDLNADEYARALDEWTRMVELASY
jgi:hypothetical protein